MSGVESPVSGVAADSQGLSWSYRIPLITNTILVWDVILVVGGICLVLGGILSLATGQIVMLYMFLGIGGGLMLLFFIIMIVLQIVLRGGFDYTFMINQKGVAYGAGKAVKKLDRASTLGSAALGSLGGAGAGAIAISQESNHLSWKEIRYAKVNRRNRAIIFRTKYLIFPVPLYCTPENFTTVLELVQKYAPGLYDTLAV